MPLITAGLGLITGIALVGLATHVTSMSNIAPELAIMIGLGVGIDYALFILTRFRENYPRNGDIPASITGAMDTSGRAILLAGATVVIALLGMFATGVTFLYGLSIASVVAVLLVLAASLTVLPALLASFRPPGRAPHPAGPPPRGQGRAAARVDLAALEHHRAAAPVAAGDRLAGRDAGVPGAVLRHAAGHQRRRQRPDQHQHLQGLQPAVRRLRPRLQRPAD